MTNKNRKDDNGKKELGRKLREAREEKKLSKSDVAERAEISPSFLNKVENGTSAPSAINLAKLAKVLGKPIEHFVSHISTVDERFDKSWELLPEEEKDRLGLKANAPFYLDFKTKKALLSIIEHIIQGNIKR